MKQSSGKRLVMKLKGLVKSTAVVAGLLGGFTFYGSDMTPIVIAEDTVEIQSVLPTSGKPDIDQMIIDAAKEHGVDPKLVYYVIKQESNFKVSASSHKDAQGLMQMIPATAQRFGVKDIYDPQQNIEGGTKYLRWLLKEFKGDVKLALAGYNAGEGAVKKNGNQIPDYKETQNYVSKIVANYGKTHHPVLEPEKAAKRFNYSTATIIAE